MTRHATACDAWTVRVLPQGSASAARYRMLSYGKAYAQALCSSIRTIHAVQAKGKDRHGSEMPWETIKIHDCECRTCQRKKKTFADNMHFASHWSRATKRKRLLSTLHYHSQSSRDARRWDQHKRSRCLVSMLLLKVIRKCISTAFNIGGVSLVEERSGSKVAYPI